MANVLDGIFAEQLKYEDSHRLLREIHRLIKAVWEENGCPSSWKISRIMALFKNKGQPSHADKYRALSVSAILNKLLIIIFLDRLGIV